MASSLDFVDHFSTVEEPRLDRTKRHELIDVLFVCVAGTIAGCDGPSDISSFAKTQLTWCQKFVELKNGAPSHDTIGRVVSLIKPDQFQKAFLAWIATLASGDDTEGPNFVPIDGKTLRGSGGAKHRDNPLHVVSAWATKQGMTLGHEGNSVCRRFTGCCEDVCNRSGSWQSAATMPHLLEVKLSNFFSSVTNFSSQDVASQRLLGENFPAVRNPVRRG